MKRAIIVVPWGVGAVLLCWALFYVAGALFGPLYQGEDESTRNFKLFILASLVSGIVGIIAGLWRTKPRA